MFELTTSVNFEAAHFIKDYPGKCNRLHGHNWKVEVTIAGTELDELGLLMDFRDLKTAVNKIMVQLDHYCLNEIEPFCRINPTAENISKYIYEQLQADLRDCRPGVALRSVTVWESVNSAATYRQEV